MSLPLVSVGQGDSRRDFHPPRAAGQGLRFLIREPAEVYEAKRRDHVTAHSLAEFRRCPQFFQRKAMGLIPERDSQAYLVGRAAHVLILQGRQDYHDEFAVGGPVNPKTGQPFGSTTKAWAEWAERIGKPVLSDDQAALIEQMAASVRSHTRAAELLADGRAEGVVRCRYEGLACQARIDWISTLPAIVDLKTADSLDGFEHAVAAFGYVHQLAFYQAMVALAGGVSMPAYLIGVEKREPFRCGVWRIAPALLDQAQAQNEEALRELARCRAEGCWPTRFEQEREIAAL